MLNADESKVSRRLWRRWLVVAGVGLMLAMQPGCMCGCGTAVAGRTSSTMACRATREGRLRHQPPLDSGVDEE